jgi:hypothetical protein
MSILLPLLAAASQQVDLSKYDPACGVAIERREKVLEAAWSDSGGARLAAAFSLENGKPLLAWLRIGDSVLARDVRPAYTVTVGSRTERANERYIFFDKPVSRPHAAHAASLDLAAVRVESAGKRVTLSFSKLSAGPFSGELAVHLYAGSPLLHVEAVLTPEAKLVAYVYDAVLEGDFRTLAWRGNDDRFVRETPQGEARPLAVRNRTVLAETEGGTIAVFPPPHAFFYPRDHTHNFKFAQAGKGRFGLRQDPAGGPGHQGAYLPWFDAPPGRAQRMAMFVFLSGQKAEETLELVKRYTHGDAFKPMDGRRTFASHWHFALAVNEMAGKSRAPEVAHVFKEAGVDIVHLAEFHGDGTPRDPGPKRLPEMKAMFDLCRKYSDDRLLFIPGEEANAHLNTPPPPGQHAGHWVYLFPRPVYLTLVRAPGQPLEEVIEPYGRVYHAGSEADMVEVLRRERALAWTAHPRIKASFACPDAYREKSWYQDDLWLGGAWKAMPGDLSHPRLGLRVLDLLDDMNTWGQRKFAHGEVDTFVLDRTHELYGHMNVNYLRLARKPTADDWSPVLECLRRGDFFVTTGEVLIHAFEASDGKVRADLEWTLPLRQAELAWWDGKEVKRRTIPLAETAEFGRRAFEWPLDLAGVRWVRMEAWDVAASGAFTQPLWLR